MSSSNEPSESNEVAEIVQEAPSIDISVSLIESRQSHGLRHDDYQRYRKYCARRLRHLRQNLNSTYTHTAKKFAKPEWSSENAKLVLIPLMESERAWSYAMQMKQEQQSPNASSRLRHSAYRKLIKAQKFACLTEKMSNQLGCSIKTQLECQAYHSWIRGLCLFDSFQWSKCLEFLNKAKHIYEKLSGIYKSDVDTYQSLTSQFIPNIRYCAYQVGDSKSEDFDELLKLATGDETTIKMIESLIETQASCLEESGRSGQQVNWLGSNFLVQNHKARMAVMKIVEIEATPVESTKLLPMIENAIKVTVDAIQAVRDELRQDPDFQAYTRSNQIDWRKISTSNPALATFFYLRFTRLRMAIERLLLIWDARNLTSDSLTSRKAQDIANAYGHAIQYIDEIIEIPAVAQNSALNTASKMTRNGLKGMRLLALVNWIDDDDDDSNGLKKLALLHQSKSLLSEALDYFKKETASIQIVGSYDICSAFDYNFKQAQKGLILAALEDKFKPQPIVQTSPIRVDPLIRAVQFLSKVSEAECSPSNLLPDLMPIPFKPFIFDIALSEVRVPPVPVGGRVEEKKEESGGGGLFSGLVKNLWWGKK